MFSPVTNSKNLSTVFTKKKTQKTKTNTTQKKKAVILEADISSLEL